jgi:hypothetical protein
MDPSDSAEAGCTMSMKKPRSRTTPAHTSEVKTHPASPEASQGANAAQAMDTRLRREKLEQARELFYVGGFSPSGVRFQSFIDNHGRIPRKREASNLDMVDEDFWQDLHEDPALYLSMVRAELGLTGLAPHAVERFQQHLARTKERRAAEAARFTPNDLLLCALEALGIPSTTAHDWVKRLPSRPSHLGYFIAECCELPGGKVTTAALVSAYQTWCESNPARLKDQVPYTSREFSQAILRECGGVSEWRTKNGRGFQGISLRLQ